MRDHDLPSEAATDEPDLHLVIDLTDEVVDLTEAEADGQHHAEEAWRAALVARQLNARATTKVEALRRTLGQLNG